MAQIDCFPPSAALLVGRSSFFGSAHLELRFVYLLLGILDLFATIHYSLLLEKGSLEAHLGHSLPVSKSDLHRPAPSLRWDFLIALLSIATFPGCSMQYASPAWNRLHLGPRRTDRKKLKYFFRVSPSPWRYSALQPSPPLRLSIRPSCPSFTVCLTLLSETHDRMGSTRATSYCR